MKVLITGTGGFIANNVADWLYRNSDNKIIGTYRHKIPKSKLFDCISCDLCHKTEIIQEKEYDAVVHFASQLYGKNIKDFLDNTVQATRNLLDIAEHKKIRKFIYISSISVCGETKGTLNEESNHINLNDYELTKFIGERLVEDSNIEQKVIIRLPRVLGKGIDYSAPWLPKISYAIMKGRDVTYYNPNLKYNALIHTDDLSQFIGEILKEDQFVNEKYVLGSDGEMTILEILELLKKEFHSCSKLVEVKAKETNRCYSVDISKAKRAGFKANMVDCVLKKYIVDMKREIKDACM